MLNGKFYTGLTANQMNRTRASNAPDRFKSSFFWPDETDAQPSTQYRASAPRTRQLSAPLAAKQQPQQQRPPAGQTAVAVEPRDLFHKQLTSKIEFNDDLSKTTPKLRRRGVGGAKMTAAIATAQDFSDIAASIEKPTGNNATTNRTSASSSNVRKSTAHASTTSVKQQPQQQRRKITFDEPTTTTKRGILKNNEVRNITTSNKRNDYNVEPIPVYKKNIVPHRAPMTRLQLSKSMDNFARLEITGTAIAGHSAPDAKASSSAKRNNVEHEREVRELSQRARRVNVDDDDDFEEPTDESDYVEREYYEKWGAASAGDHDNEKEVMEERSHHHQHYETEIEHHSNSHYNPINQRANNHNNDVIGYAKHYADVKQAAIVPVPVPVVIAPAVAVPPPQRYYANEAAQRAQTHLRSNIFFDDAEASSRSGPTVDRPRSVRESAVARVGVGLPNI